MLLRTLLFFCMLAISLPGKAQLMDSIRESLSYKPKLTAFLDTRNSFINNLHVKVRGVKLGLNYNNTTKFAIGYNWLSQKSEVEKQVEVIDSQGELRIYNAEMNMWYINGYFEYSFFKTRYWNASIPLQLGAGRAWYTYENDADQEIRIDEGTIVFYEAAMTLIYKPIRLIGVGGGIGYRLSLTKPQSLNTRLTAPMYMIKFNLYLGELFRKS